MLTRRRRAALVTIPAAALVLLAAPAHAHVTVSSPDAIAGGYGKLVFRVPNESDTASTTQLQVRLPEDLPFASVRTLEVPGWTAEITVEQLDEPVAVGDLNLTEAPATVTWTADEGHAIGSDEFAEFALSVGPFVDDPSATYEFAAVQTYDDGEVVAWDQSSESSPEPERPAPTLDLAGAVDAPATQRGDESSTDTAARWLGGAGLLLGSAALVVAGSSRRRLPAGA